MWRQGTSIYFDMYRNYNKNCSNCLFLQQFPGELLLPPLFHHSASHRVLQQHSDTLSADSDIIELAVWRSTGRRELHSLASGLIQLLATKENIEDRAKKSPSGIKLCSTTQCVQHQLSQTLLSQCTDLRLQRYRVSCQRIPSSPHQQAPSSALLPQPPHTDTACDEHTCSSEWLPMVTCPYMGIQNQYQVTFW